MLDVVGGKIPSRGFILVFILVCQPLSAVVTLLLWWLCAVARNSGGLETAIGLFCGLELPLNFDVPSKVMVRDDSLSRVYDMTLASVQRLPRLLIR